MVKPINMKYLKYRIALLSAFVFIVQFSFAETGYRLWLRYDRIENRALLEKYNSQIKSHLGNLTIKTPKEKAKILSQP